MTAPQQVAELKHRLAELDRLAAERRINAPTHYGEVDRQRDEESACIRATLASTQGGAA